MFQKKKNEEFLNAYEKYADDIYRHCYFRVHNKELAEDLTQETFIKTWKYISDGKEIKNIRSFLYKVAVNLVIDNSRKKKEMYLGNIDQKESKGSLRLINKREETNIFNKFECGEIIKLLNNLPENQKQVIVMRYIDEFMPSEIAKILGESPNAVSVRITQSVIKLRKIISEKYHTNDNKN